MSVCVHACPGVSYNLWSCSERERPRLIRGCPCLMPVLNLKVPVFDLKVSVFDWTVPVFDWKVPVFDWPHFRPAGAPALPPNGRVGVGHHPNDATNERYGGVVVC